MNRNSRKAKLITIIVLLALMAVSLCCCGQDVSKVAGNASQVNMLDDVEQNDTDSGETDSWPYGEESAVDEPQDEQMSPITTYILNTNTKKFHYPDCRSVKAMKDKNKQEVEASREEIIAMGFDPCGNCNP